jgi:hypothetical protein
VHFTTLAGVPSYSEFRVIKVRVCGTPLYFHYKQLSFDQKKLYTNIKEKGSLPLNHLINIGKEYAGLLLWGPLKVGVCSINNFILTI